MKRQITLLFSAFILMGFLIILFIKTIELSSKNYWLFTESLQNVRESNAKINESVLKTFLSISKDYDSLVNERLHLKEELIKLKRESESYESDELNNAIINLKEKIDEKLINIERFKSKNAVLKNSTTYLETLNEALWQDVQKEKDTEIKMSINKVIWLASNFLNDNRDNTSREFDHALESVQMNKKTSPAIRETLETIKSHKKIVDKYKPSVADLVATLTDKVIANQLIPESEMLHRIASNKIDQANKNYQTAMLAISIILFIYTVGVVLTLWKTMSAMKILNKNLETRVIQRTREIEKRNEIIQNQGKSLVYSSKMSALGEMASGIAHEINNPLTIIALTLKSLFKALKQENKNFSLIERNLQTIEDTTNRIEKIVKGLRTFSANSEKADIKSTNFDNLLTDTLSLCQEKFKNHGIELIVDIKDGEKEIQCNPISISQVILNLLNNAYDAIERESSPWVKIETQVHDQMATISVTDCGAGISPEISQKMMQPFFTTKEIGKGTGLGLSISKGLLENNGGKLEFQTASPNTKFTLSFPINPPV
jgi:signal transduction histidine kinase